MFFSGLETQADLNRLLDRLCGSDERVLERAVETTGEFVQQRVVRLARCYPLPLLGEAAREELQQLRPSVQEALGALEEIEGRRGLTDEELAKRHAFMSLLTVRV
jgi:hypothetical protein